MLWLIEYFLLQEMRASPQPRGRLLRHLTRGVLLLLLGLAAVLTPFLFSIWKASGGDNPDMAVDGSFGALIWRTRDR